jgi:excisionase family DNA binding protein
MNITIITLEELKVLVKTSVDNSLSEYYSQKSKKENLSQNFTVKDAANFLNVSELTIRNYIKRGLIKADRLGNRIIINRVKLEDSLKEFKSLKYRR